MGVVQHAGQLAVLLHERRADVGGGNELLRDPGVEPLEDGDTGGRILGRRLGRAAFDFAQARAFGPAQAGEALPLIGKEGALPHGGLIGKAGALPHGCRRGLCDGPGVVEDVRRWRLAWRRLMRTFQRFLDSTH